MLAILSPGQGAQAPGMLEPWLELPGAGSAIDRFSATAELDLHALGTTADAETIRDTAVAQPLIVAASLLSAQALLGSGAAASIPAPGTAYAGHSVGEIAATALAGVLSEDAALALVAERGRAMAEAAAQRETGMAAIVGGTPEGVHAALERHGLTPANVNGGGQIVAAGTTEQLDALAADPALPELRARVIALQVAGAFHTEHMAPAVERVRALASTLEPAEPHQGARLLSNRDGAVVAGGQDALERLVTQVANPVRWDLCCEQLLALGVTGVIELAPAGVLTGLARRTLKGVDTLALKSPDDLPAAHELIAQHGAAS